MRTTLLALALGLVMAGPALADHVYSHRYVFEGRLIGSDGTPLTGREVVLIGEGESFDHACGTSPHQAITDAWGDFRFCFHKHVLRTTTRITATYGNVSVVKPMDTAFRRTVVTLHEPNETGEAPPGWERTYRVAGRAWMPGPTTLEGVPVFGIAVEDLPVNLTIEGPGGKRELQNVTDVQGDFDFTFVLAPNETVDDMTVRLEAEGRYQPVRLDPVSHRTTAPLYVAARAPQEGAIGVSFPEATAARVASPGGDPPVSGGLVVTMLAGLALVSWLAARKRA